MTVVMRASSVIVQAACSVELLFGVSKRAVDYYRKNFCMKLVIEEARSGRCYQSRRIRHLVDMLDDDVGSRNVNEVGGW